MKKIILLFTLMLSCVLVNAQEDGQFFEKEYKFPLAINNGKCGVTGAADFTSTSFTDDILFTNFMFL